MNKAKSKSSKRWLQEHFNDIYVQRARKEGARSRSAYKLLEIQKKDKIIKPGMVAVDLGAAPGGWSKAAADLTGVNGKIFALDILPMEPVTGVDFIQGDFREENILSLLLQRLNSQPVDLVLSDMAPNISGIKSVDQSKSMYLAELAVDFARQVLKTDGALLVKVFQGEGFDPLLKVLRECFGEVKIRKPSASRARSKELFLLAKGFQKIYNDTDL